MPDAVIFDLDGLLLEAARRLRVAVERCVADVVLDSLAELDAGLVEAA